MVPKLKNEFPSAVVDKHCAMFLRGPLAGMELYHPPQNPKNILVVEFLGLGFWVLTRHKSCREVGWSQVEASNLGWDVTNSRLELAGAKSKPEIVTGFCRIPSQFPERTWLWPSPKS